MKISEIITDKYKLRIPPTVYYELLTDVVEAEEEQEFCGDAISRDAVLIFIEKVKESGIVNYGSLLDIAAEVRNLPPVIPQPKTGHWIIYDVHGHKACKCSECDKDAGYPCKDKYCRHCGHRMKEAEE